ncbi:MAG: hypothetical protein Q7R73_01205 [bacterium]|nr:hypothetical protein [bacterium]
METSKTHVFDVIKKVKRLEKHDFLGDEVTLKNTGKFRFPCMRSHELRVGRKIFIDFTFPSNAGLALIHVFAADDEMKHSTDAEGESYKTSYLLRKDLLRF